MNRTLLALMVIAMIAGSALGIFIYFYFYVTIPKGIVFKSYIRPNVH